MKVNVRVPFFIVLLFNQSLSSVYCDNHENFGSVDETIRLNRHLRSEASIVYRSDSNVPLSYVDDKNDTGNELALNQQQLRHRNLLNRKLACQIGIKFLARCVCDENSLQNAVNRASTSPTNPTKIQICYGTTIEMQQDIDLTGKSIDFSCRTSNGIFQNNNQQGTNNDNTELRQDCILSGGLNTRMFSGAPVYVSFKEIVFQFGNANKNVLRGGAMYFTGSTVGIDISKCIFDRNRAESGGAITIEGSSTKLVINDSKFIDNTGNSGGALYAFRDASVNINGTLFAENKATSGAGGALYLDESESKITSSKFSNNVGTIDSATGGALFAFKSKIEIDESVFTANKAGNMGTAGDDIFISDNGNPTTGNDGSYIKCSNIKPVTFCNGLDRIVEFDGTTPFVNTNCKAVGVLDPKDGRCTVTNT